LNVLDEVQLGGNNAVRKVIYDYMVNKDVDGRLLQVLSHRMERSIEEIVEAKNMGILGAKGDNVSVVVVLLPSFFFCIYVAVIFQFVIPVKYKLYVYQNIK
jgi:hypothetical protein